MVKKQFVIAVGFGLVIGGCLALGSRLFEPKPAQAQCVQFYFASGPALSVDCGVGSKLSEVQSNSTRYTALCA